MLVDRFDVEAHRYGGEGHHVAFVAAAVRAGAGVADIGLGIEECNTAGDLFTREARHAGRVAINSACVVGRRGSPSVTSTHPADAVFVDGKASCEDLGGCHGNGEAKGGFEHDFFHY